MRTEQFPLRLSGVGVALLVLSIIAGAALTAALQNPTPLIVAALAGLYLLFSIRIADQWEKVAVLRFGRFRVLKGPGVFLIIPIVDTLSRYVDQRVRVTTVSAESTLTAGQMLTLGAAFSNAVLRQSGTATLSGPVDPIRITVDDVEVSETETRTQAAVALLVDTSFSMVMENRWLPMKQTALALNHLVCTRFRSDALQIIAFGRYARTVTAAELTGLEGVYEQGTNLHHALALAGRHLRRHPNAQPVVLVVTDGEPTAHLEDFDGSGTGSTVFFDYPPHPRTIAHTVRGFDDMARLGAQVTIFRLGDDPGLARFIDQVARRVEGRVVVPDVDGLGAAVVGDYLRSRRRR